MSVWRTNDAKTPNTTTTGPRWASIKAPIGPADTKVLISALAVAVGDSDTVWVGHANGQVLRTADGTAGQPLAAGHVRGVPRRYCMGITIDPADSQHVYVYFGEFARGTCGQPVTAEPPGPICRRRCPPRPYGHSRSTHAEMISSTPAPRSACSPARTPEPPGHRPTRPHQLLGR